MKKGLFTLMLILTFVAMNVIYATQDINVYSEVNVYEEDMLKNDLMLSAPNTLMSTAKKTVVYFESQVLKQAIIDEGYDTDYDGELSPEEMLEMEYLCIENAGTIASLTGLEYATNMNNLEINECGLTDISAISNLTNLQYLRLYYNNISDISAVANLKNLKELSLAGNNITNISSLYNLTKLEILSIWSNNISDISVIANLTNITYLDLDYNNITNINPLEKLTKLEVLCLSENNIKDISVLANLKKLESLSLSGNNITDIRCLTAISELDYVYLGENNITDDKIGVMYAKELQLYGNQIEDLESLMEKLPYCEFLSVYNNYIKDISYLKNIEKLPSFIDLSENEINVYEKGNKEAIEFLNNSECEFIYYDQYPDYIVGDINGDLVVDNKDVKYLGNYLNGVTGYIVKMENADTNMDMIIDWLDYKLLKMAIAEEIYLPVGHITGDINRDFHVDEGDLNYFAKYLNGNKDLVVIKELADVNLDGLVDWEDYKRIKFSINEYNDWLIEVSYDLGDVNRDDSLDEADINYLGKYLNGRTDLVMIKELADVNYDGLIDWLDYKAIKETVLEDNWLIGWGFETGDVNRDFIVDEADVNYIGKYLNGRTDLVMIEKLADVNLDGIIDWSDYKVLKKYVNYDDDDDYTTLPKTYAIGDTNRDYVVDQGDLNYLGKYLNGKNVEVVDMLLDVNMDETIDWLDYSILKKHLAGEAGYEIIPKLHARGDVNKDFVVDERDVTYFGKHLNGTSGYDVTEKIADINRDGKVDWEDYKLLKTMV